MFTIVSGLPGAAKTLNTINRFKNKGGQVFYYGIPLTEQGRATLKWIELNQEQVKNWEDEVSPGATLIVDEAQILWPVRPATKPVPPELKALETHRHKGVDIVFITQDPTLLDSHARKLANDHYHYVRPYGAKYTIQHHNGSGVVDIKNKTDLNNTIKQRIKFPTDVYPLYKSAEVHTHKFRIPPRLLVLPFLIAIVGYLLWNFYTSMSAKADEPAPHPSNPPQQQQMEKPSSPSPSDDMELASTSWAYLLQPEIPGVPFTAPLYRERAMQVADVPRVAGCIQMNNVCRCYTQQGSPVNDVSRDICQQYLKHHPFNHMRSPHIEQQTEPDQQYQREQLAINDRPRKQRFHFIPNSTNY